MSYFYACVIYTVLRNRFYPDSIEGCPAGVCRAADQAPKAQAWVELVQKYGHEDWIEPLLDELGPIL
jgi:hypothetical protein